MATMRLVLASNNAKKLAELRALLDGLALELVPQGALGVPEAEEPHITFVENALAKARAAASATGGAAMSDDSGLCVPALGGAPGVISADYAGPVQVSAGTSREGLRAVQDAANNQRLLQALDGVADRSAYFVCTLVALRHAEDPQPLIATARWPGEIIASQRGQGGFGYDPLMFIPALGVTVAELAPEVKNRLSHRALAAALLRQQLAEVWRV